jgi:hypothetical protein
VALGPGFPEVAAAAKPAATVGPGFPEVADAAKPAAPVLSLGDAVFKSSFAFFVSIWFSMSDDSFLFCFEEPQAEIKLVSSSELDPSKSVFGIRVRIQEGKNDPQKQGKIKNF